MLGAYGMLGHRLLLDLGRRYDVVGTVRKKRQWDAPIMDELSAANIVPGVDASDLESIRSTIRRFKPAVVVNCIGIVKQAQAAKDPITSITINSLFPHQLVKIARESGVRVVHLSTDCVFSGREGKYKQDQDPDPVDLYGRSKLLGEVTDGAMTIRSSLIGREIDSRNGLVEWFLSNRGRSVTGFRKAIFSGFPTGEMARIIGMLIEEQPRLQGVWQVASDPISKFDLISKMNDQEGTGVKIIPNDMVICDRSLDGSLFSQATGYRTPGWDDMIKSMVKDFHLYETRG